MSMVSECRTINVLLCICVATDTSFVRSAVWCSQSVVVKVDYIYACILLLLWFFLTFTFSPLLTDMADAGECGGYFAGINVCVQE